MITWTTYKTTDGWNREVESTRTSHEGVVLTPSFTRCERVMSDIYADVSYCLVWDRESGRAIEVSLGAHFELCSTFGHAVVDATPEVVAAYEAWQAEVEAKRQAAEQARRLEAAKAAWNAPAVGKTMRVARGRKVPVGTTGEVFWLGAGNYGPRAGLALSNRTDARGRFVDVVFVDARNLDNATTFQAAA